MHGGHILVGKPHGLQISETPPDLAKRRFHFKRTPICGNRGILFAHGFEHMAIAHPQFGMIGKTLDQVLVQPDRFLITADASKCSGLQVLLRGIVALFRQNSIQLFQRLGKAILFIEHGRQIRPRHAKGRREL